MTALVRALRILPRVVVALHEDLIWHLGLARNRYRVVARDLVVPRYSLSYPHHLAPGERLLTRHPYGWLCLNARGEFSLDTTPVPEQWVIRFSRRRDRDAFLRGCCKA